MFRATIKASKNCKIDLEPFDRPLEAVSNSSAKLSSWPLFTISFLIAQI